MIAQARSRQFQLVTSTAGIRSGEIISEDPYQKRAEEPGADGLVGAAITAAAKPYILTPNIMIRLPGNHRRIQDAAIEPISAAPFPSQRDHHRCDADQARPIQAAAAAARISKSRSG